MPEKQTRENLGERKTRPPNERGRRNDEGYFKVSRQAGILTVTTYCRKDFAAAGVYRVYGNRTLSYRTRTVVYRGTLSEKTQGAERGGRAELRAVRGLLHGNAVRSRYLGAASYAVSRFKSQRQRPRPANKGYYCFCTFTLRYCVVYHTRRVGRYVTKRRRRRRRRRGRRRRQRSIGGRDGEKAEEYVDEGCESCCGTH